MKKPWVLSYPLKLRLFNGTMIRLGGCQAHLSLRWAHTYFVGFVMSRLKYNMYILSMSNLVLCIHGILIVHCKVLSVQHERKALFKIPILKTLETFSCCFVWQTCLFLILGRIMWAPSSEFVSLSIPSWQILTAHAQPFRGARDLAFCLKVPLDSLLVWASSEGSGETARMRSSPEPSLLA